MNLDVVFDVPAKVAEGLSNGSLERVGGVVRDSSSKKVVMWLQEGVSKPPFNPPLAGGEALAVANTMLSTANLGVSVAGFTMVLQQLNRISDQIRLVEAKVDQISHKLDDQALAQLKAGINACQNAWTLWIQICAYRWQAKHSPHFMPHASISTSKWCEALVRQKQPVLNLWVLRSSLLLQKCRPICSWMKGAKQLEL